MPIEQLVKSVCNYKQGYTQFGGLRPFGVAFLVAGWDQVHGFQLYQTDPSGNFSGWKATVIGQNNQAGKSLLKTDYKEDGLVMDNMKLAVRILMKTLDAATPSPERIELTVMSKDATGRLTHVTIPDSDVRRFIDQIEAEEKAEAKKAEASSGDI